MVPKPALVECTAGLTDFVREHLGPKGWELGPIGRPSAAPAHQKNLVCESVQVYIVLSRHLMRRWNHMSAYEQGFQAGKAGEPEYKCPYEREGIKRRDWQRGWESGRNSNYPVSPDSLPNLPADS
jgi:ribosome modulation factor